MAGLGFSEIITYSFIAPETVDILEPEEKDQLTSFVRLLKPLTVEQSVMRTTLLPGLMDTARTNILNNEKELKLFEWGKIFIRNGDQPQPFEKISLAALVSGLYHQKRWYGDERMVDFYDIKGAVEAFLKGLGAEEFQFKKVAAFPGYNPDVSAGIYCAGSLVGRLGQVSPSVMAAYNIEKVSAYIFELDIDLLQARIPGIKKFQPFAKYPAVYRDISIIVKRTLESSKIIEIIREAGGDLVENIQIFDLYEGKKIDPSEKALAFKICYRSKNKTLDGNEMNLFHESVIDRIKQETGGRLKEG